jgi:RNA polymerase sigma-70 factor (ECF subfamily)
MTAQQRVGSLTTYGARLSPDHRKAVLRVTDAPGLAAAKSPRTAAETVLLSRCIAGQRSAWSELYREYHPIAVAFLRHLGVGEEDLEDASQEVFARCHRALTSFRGEARFKTWFYRLCLTEASRFRRRNRIAHTIRQVIRESADDSVSAQMDATTHAIAQQVHSAISMMSSNNRKAFILYELEGLSGKRVAQLLGCPVATVWRRVHYARRAFRDALAGPSRPQTPRSVLCTPLTRQSA